MQVTNTVARQLDVKSITPSSAITRLPMLGVLFNKLPICFRLRVSASPAMDIGRCFLFLLRLTSDPGSILCCQQVTLARNSWGDRADSFRRGTDLEEEVRFISDWDDEDLIESLLFISDREEDFRASDFSDLSECFQAFLSPVWRGTEARRWKLVSHY